MDSVKKLADATVVAYPVVSLGLLVVLILLVLYLLFRKEKYGGGPTSMMRGISQDQAHVGWTASENRERAEGGKPAAPAAAPAVAGPKEGSAAWNVLHSDDFACDKREPAGDDAWSWMVGHSRDAETARGGRLSDNVLSQKLSGNKN